MENDEEKQKQNISYETLWKFIIRPSRDVYNEDDLGIEKPKYNNKIYVRKDYDVLSSEGYILKCSFIEPDEDYRPTDEMPVVIYLHGNSSSRVEGMKMLPYLLKNDINLFVFDFAGSGLSEGEYISLGYHEKDDVKVIVDFLEKLPGVGKIGLWGRSMGAATAMLYTYTDSRIFASCLDSPFADFSVLAKELSLKQVKLPGFILDTALAFIRRTILGKNGLDIYKLRPIEAAKKTTTPLMFIHCINDELIPTHHTVDLTQAYLGKPIVKYLEKGGHNSKRPTKLIEEVLKFFTKYLKESNSQLNDDDQNQNKSEIKNK